MVVVPRTRLTWHYQLHAPARQLRNHPSSHNVAPSTTEPHHPSLNHIRPNKMPPKASPPRPTHFLCIPLAGSQLARSLASFRADVTSPTSFNVPEQAVRPLGTLHLTLGVMNLEDETLTQAVNLLRELRLKDVLDHARTSPSGVPAPAARAMGREAPPPDKRLSITLQGLRSMNKASEASVLYAPPTDPSGLLRRFCEHLREIFQQAGLMMEDQRPLLLHATVVNTVYVKGRGRGKQRLTIDARDILGRYDDYAWMEGMPVRRVAICRMGARAVEGSYGDEAYDVEAEVSF